MTSFYLQLANGQCGRKREKEAPQEVTGTAFQPRQNRISKSHLLLPGFSWEPYGVKAKNPRLSSLLCKRNKYPLLSITLSCLLFGRLILSKIRHIMKP